jgi:hypothetical protein
MYICKSKIKKQVIFMSHIEDFFIASNSVKSVQEESYEKMQPLIQAVEASGRLSYQSVYLIDYFKQTFVLKSRLKVDSIYHLLDY